MQTGKLKKTTESSFRKAMFQTELRAILIGLRQKENNPHYNTAKRSYCSVKVYKATQTVKEQSAVLS